MFGWSPVYGGGVVPEPDVAPADGLRPLLEYFGWHVFSEALYVNTLHPCGFASARETQIAQHFSKVTTSATPDVVPLMVRSWPA